MTARKYDPICSYPGCGRKHNSHGLCSPHGAMQRRGEPLRPLQKRTGPIERPEAERFADRIALQDDGCIVWFGGKTIGGYGSFGPAGSGQKTKVLAHRWSYEYHVGPIPSGLQLDHLCRNRACVNPDHLEPVTAAENVRRAFRDRTHCQAGHAYDEANTYVPSGTQQRRCRACARERDLARRERRNAQRRAARAAEGPKVRALKSHCLRGHELAGENLYIAPKSGARGCRECRRMNAIERKAA